MDILKTADPDIFQAIANEARRQQDGLEMIASENYTSRAVMAAQGSVLTNKYAEGYPGKRYYGGCEFVDVAERLAIERLLRLFAPSPPTPLPQGARGENAAPSPPTPLPQGARGENAAPSPPTPLPQGARGENAAPSPPTPLPQGARGDFAANVQPHSGAQANMAVYFAALNHGDTILAMDLAHGGHLTHGMHLNFSGKWYKIVGYGVRPSDERIDFDQVAKLAREHKPKLIVAGASAYSREIDFARFKQIAQEVGALFMVDMAHIAGLVAADQHVSPVPFADFVTSTTHKTLRGPRGGVVLCRAEWEKKINSAVFPGLQGGPLMHVIAAKAVSFREALEPSFKTYAVQTIANAKTLAAELARLGFRIVSGGTDNHLMLVDVTPRGLAGKIAEETLDHAGITVNKNKIPFDQRPPLDPSGIRIGTPALTTRGMREPQMRQIAAWIDTALSHVNEKAVLERVRGQVREMGRQFPAPA